jgi:hypothetical protein
MVCDSDAGGGMAAEAGFGDDRRNRARARFPTAPLTIRTLNRTLGLRMRQSKVRHAKIIQCPGMTERSSLCAGPGGKWA